MKPKPVETLLRETKLDQVAKAKLVHCSPDTPLKQAIELMQQNQAGYVVVMEKKRVTGLFTEVDLVRKVLEQKVDWNSPICDFMEKDPVILTRQDTVEKVIDIMSDRRIYHIPVVNEQKELIEVLSVRSIIKLLAEFYPAEVLNLPPKPNQIMETVEGG